MEPARTIISILGGASTVANATGVHRTRVYGWMRSKSAGGTGGVIPLRHIRILIAFAKTKGIQLSAEDFLPNVSISPAFADDLSNTFLCVLADTADAEKAADASSKLLDSS